MSASGSGVSWLSLYEEKKHEVEQRIKPGEVPDDIQTPNQFRSAFENLCGKKGEFNPSRLETQFISRIQIANLARAVRESSPELKQLSSGNTPEGLLWRVIHAFIEVGFGNHLQATDG